MSLLQNVEMLDRVSMEWALYWSYAIMTQTNYC